MHEYCSVATGIHASDNLYTESTLFNATAMHWNLDSSRGPSVRHRCHQVPLSQYSASSLSYNLKCMYISYVVWVEDSVEGLEILVTVGLDIFKHKHSPVNLGPQNCLCFFVQNCFRHISTTYIQGRGIEGAIFIVLNQLNEKNSGRIRFLYWLFIYFYSEKLT